MECISSPAAGLFQSPPHGGVDSVTVVAKLRLEISLPEIFSNVMNRVIKIVFLHYYNYYT